MGATTTVILGGGFGGIVPLPGRYKPDVGLSLPKAGVFAAAQGRVAAHQIAATILGRAPDEVFDGRGYCYLETGASRAVKAEGSFFALPIRSCRSGCRTKRNSATSSSGRNACCTRFAEFPGFFAIFADPDGNRVGLFSET